MKIKTCIFCLIIAISFSCTNNSSSANDAENAFAKIDKKNESLFTKEERKLQLELKMIKKFLEEAQRKTNRDFSE